MPKNKFAYYERMNSSPTAKYTFFCSFVRGKAVLPSVEVFESRLEYLFINEEDRLKAMPFATDWQLPHPNICFFREAISESRLLLIPRNSLLLLAPMTHEGRKEGQKRGNNKKQCEQHVLLLISAVFSFCGVGPRGKCTTAAREITILR